MENKMKEYIVTKYDWVLAQRKDIYVVAATKDDAIDKVRFNGDGVVRSLEQVGHYTKDDVDEHFQGDRADWDVHVLEDAPKE
jgi:hypothetical protein